MAVIDKKRADDDNRHRRKEKVRKLNQTAAASANTTCYVQILGTGMDTHDTSASVLLFFDKHRFMFNAGEGLQRFCTEHQIKLLKIDHIFLSRVCSETAGGLPGLLLTLAGMGDKVNIWGSSDLTYFVDAMKSFIPRAAMVHSHSFGPSPGSNGSSSCLPKEFDEPLVLIDDDDVVKISAVLLRPTCSEAMDSAEPKKPGGVSVIYICELPEIKGKFDPKKAVSLGLRPGPKYRELQLGNSVKSDCEDIMVHPRDVMDPSIPGPVVMIVDCPTPLHLHELLSLRCLAPYYVDTTYKVPENSKVVNCVIHLSPTFVTKTDDYRMWMSKFGDSQHIMAGHEMKNIEVPIMKSSARIGARLNYLCPHFFPASSFWSLQHLNCLPSDSGASDMIFSSRPNELPAENLLKFHLRPYASLGIDRSNIPNLSSTSDIIKELLSEIPEIADASKQVGRFWSGDSMGAYEIMTEESSVPSCLVDISREDMEIVLLGTGSSQPSKYRNVSSIFINLFSKGSLLLDCGEGTLGQLKRRFGVKGADEAVRGLRCIWISHIHADHHAGLARILAHRRDLLKGLTHKPIVVVGPGLLRPFLDAYQKLEDLDMQFLDCWYTAIGEVFELEKENHPSWSPMQSAVAAIPIVESLNEVLNEAGLEALISFPVIHCREAFGVVLKAANRINRVGKSIPGWKIVYSGDTRPCPERIMDSHGTGATVLIHEATFGTELVKEAEEKNHSMIEHAKKKNCSMIEHAIGKNHSTTKEATTVGKTVEAYRIILTHFSQRYPKIPVLGKTGLRKAGIAFDLMSVNLADIHLLPKMLPYLKLLFRDYIDESECVNTGTDTDTDVV